MRSRSAVASSPGTTKPVVPSSTSAETSPVSAATTGRAQAIASRTTFGVPSTSPVWTRRVASA
ncbi:MAG: hypothetical protein A3E31_05575 [Candidatus Rokubacteria bacterium RIFCSPHIGHO2_12_FULL_73_22]|nr:MAG: hypothetical protein A3E31_05575 [Candidatus Rokubacteria bacterium RIFCSPHIGHO2_12_FULL_73_22]